MSRCCRLFGPARPASGALAGGLSCTLDGGWAHRGLEVIRARGQAPLLGRHSLTLSERGIEVFPRLETCVTGASRQVQLPAALGKSIPVERVTFGLRELDALLGGWPYLPDQHRIGGEPGHGQDDPRPCLRSGRPTGAGVRGSLLWFTSYLVVQGYTL